LTPAPEIRFYSWGRCWTAPNPGRTTAARPVFPTEVLPMTVRTGVKAGVTTHNHNQTAVKVRTAVKAGGIGANHNQTAVKVLMEVKASANK
jgi:hypothetical protein